jgi:hypothetical protein
MIMTAFETSTTVQASGDVRVAGLPFAPGTEVEVSISPKRGDSREFSQRWERVSGKLRALKQLGSISDEEIRAEIDDYRAGR